MGVDALALQRHPVRPEIALFEDVIADAATTRGQNRTTMHRATVAEDHLVGDAVTLPDPAKELGNVLGLATIDVGVSLAPVYTVTYGEIDLGHRVARRPQPLAQPVEER